MKLPSLVTAAAKLRWAGAAGATAKAGAAISGAACLTDANAFDKNSN